MSFSEDPDPCRDLDTADLPTLLDRAEEARLGDEWFRSANLTTIGHRLTDFDDVVAVRAGVVLIIEAVRCGGTAGGLPAIRLARLVRDGRLEVDVFPEVLPILERYAPDGDDYWQEAIDVWHRNNQDD